MASPACAATPTFCCCVLDSGEHLFGTQDVRRGCSGLYSRAAAEHLIREMPELKALAVDFTPSRRLAAHGRRLARPTPRVFLGCAGYSDRNVLLIEHARLPRGHLPVPGRIIVAPWLFEGLDSAPCTMIAEFANQERNV